MQCVRSITIAGVGFGCDAAKDPEFKMKFVVGTNLQVLVGGQVKPIASPKP